VTCLVRRRRVVAFISFGVIGLATSARDARAADESMLFQKRERTFESPQHFAFELRMGPYKPDIDSDPALGNSRPWDQTFGEPYQSVFGTSQRLLVAAELDWQFLHFPHIGSLGAGGSFGYTSMAAPARRADNPTLFLPGETTTLDVYPMYAVAVFRFDALNKDFGVPLVPYAKAGIGVALWRASTDIGTSKSANGTEGEGHTFGFQVAAGVGLDLNAFDRSSAHAFDESMGVNHTYIYVEWMDMALNGLGQSSALRVGSSTWVSGLALEF
jgi:opacity protein-like surface antigen